MGQGKRVLFVSNGYGEDNVAAHIAAELKNLNPSHVVHGFPTVGSGKFYNALTVDLAGKGINLPSEGFVRSFKDFVLDIKNGFFSKTFGMGHSLRQVSANYDVLAAVGDPYILLFSSMFSRVPRRKKIFVGLLQSEWYESLKPFKLHYSFVERLWVKWFCSLVIVRDMKTRDYLLKKGLDCTVSFGNPMMDCFEIQNQRIFPEDRTLVGILPGSKQEAYDNFGKILETALQLTALWDKKQKLLFAVAFSPNLDTKTLEKRYNLQSKAGSKLSISSDKLKVYSVKKKKIDLVASKELFGNIIAEAKAVIGLSGTGNEQAAGMGKPVFSFWGNGPQITKKFLKAQNRLLGGSLFLLPPDPVFIARRMYEVMNSRQTLSKVERNGKMRMAGRGSVRKIARAIDKFASG